LVKLSGYWLAQSLWLFFSTPDRGCCTGDRGWQLSEVEISVAATKTRNLKLAEVCIFMSLLFSTLATANNGSEIIHSTSKVASLFNDATPNRRFQFQKRRQLFIRTRNETLSVVAMCVSNEDRSPVEIHCCDAAQL
jgi:hypothetical protein